MPTVYVSQLPHKRDPSTGTHVPAYDITSAALYGTIRILIPPQAPYTDPVQFIPQLKRLLKNYDTVMGDVLLLLGDPVVIAAVVAIAAAKGEFKVLRWNRSLMQYFPVPISPCVGAESLTL